MIRLMSLLTALALACLAAGTVAVAAGENGMLDELITAHLIDRGATVQLAPPGQLARRYAIDLTGVVPTLEDLEATVDMSPGQMFDYFASKGPLPHTGALSAYAWINLLQDADHFLFSNSTQFSQIGHIQEFHSQLARVYAEDWSYQEFARWALTSMMFLNRFPSAADRANASFFLFLGRNSFASEVPVGNMWNGYYLRDPNIPEANAETDPDFHVYDFDATRCTDGTALCEAVLWDQVGSTPEDAVEAMVTSSLFAEATVDRYWHRLIGSPLPGVDFPIIRTALAQGLIQNGYSVNWLIREIAISPAYTQEMMYR